MAGLKARMGIAGGGPRGSSASTGARSNWRGRRRLGKAGAMTRRDVAFWKPHRSAELAGRDIDQHQVQRPLAEPILGHGCLPARQPDLAAVAGTDARPRQFDLAPVEAELPLGPPPAIPILAFSPAIAHAAKPGRVLLHHVSQCRDARRQAEAVEARCDLL